MKKLTQEQIEALNEFITHLRYEYEGPRDIDSTEEFMDEYISVRS